MKSRYVFLPVAAALLTAVAHTQDSGGIRVLRISVPAQMRQPAQVPLLVPYSGNFGENAVVRVFRGSKTTLMHDIPKMTVGDCILYSSTVTYPLYADGQMLHLGRVLEFFNLMWNAQHQKDQVITLVFEQGGNNVSNGQLSIKRDFVPRYFTYAVELPLYATDDMVNDWAVQQRQMAANAQPAGGSLWSSIAGFFKPTPVAAAVRAPVPVGSAGADAPTVAPELRSCQVVSFAEVEKTPETLLAEMGAGEGEDFDLIRRPVPCGR